MPAPGSGPRLADELGPTQSGMEFKGTQSYEGKWAGTGTYPESTLPYFDFYFKGNNRAGHTGYVPNELFYDTLMTNSPKIGPVLDVERRNLDSETMGAVANCLLDNTQVTEARLARNVSFWSEQPDDFGMAIAAVIAKNKTITKLDLKNNDIHEDAVEQICLALAKNTTITWLDFSDNFSHNKGAELAAMIKANKTLKFLDLSVNQLTDEDAKLVLDAVDENKTLTEFHAYNNGAMDKATRKRLRGFKK